MLFLDCSAQYIYMVMFSIHQATSSICHGQSFSNHIRMHVLQMCKTGVSPIQALQLCWDVYQFHFQFLVFLGSYVKLLNVFYAAKQAERVSCTKASQCMVESTDMKLAWCSHIMYGTYIMCIFRFLPCIDIIDECMSMAKERCYIF